MGMFDQPMEPMSAYTSLIPHNFIRRFAPMFNEGLFRLSVETGKIPARERFFYLELPWIPSNMIPGRKCDFWLEMMARGCLGFIPNECRDCWKVVVRPKTLEQLFKLLVYQQQCGYECKCGIEVRKYVRGNYGGYFYTHSYEECGDRYMEVRAEMNKIDPEMSVIMKRSCTEYERDFGPSNEYQRPDDADHWEAQLDYYVDYQPSNNKLPPTMIAEIKQRWIDFAWQLDDPTVDQFTSGKQLYPPVYTYHDQYVKEVKNA